MTSIHLLSFYDKDFPLIPVNSAVFTHFLKALASFARFRGLPSSSLALFRRFRWNGDSSLLRDNPCNRCIWQNRGFVRAISWASEPGVGFL
jgi:hypothetical protein